MPLREQLQQTLGNAYRLERELGGGGMSRVFVAEETALGRRVVVKVLPPEVAADVNADRFKREIQMAARLQHPHIVPVLSSGEMDGIPYYTMPFVEGESVRARLVRVGRLSITETIGILRDVSKALAYAHERGIVHRDIKPDNVLLSGGSATVTDFGIAKAIAASRSETGTAIPTLTTIGSSIGTPAYMAPEQAAADPATNHRADIYAYGCTAYEMLAGRPPFVEKNPQRLLAAQMSDTPEPIQALRPDVPPVLAELVMRCLAKDADARPQNAADIVQVLESVTSGGGYAPMPALLLSGRGMLAKVLLGYVAAFIFVTVLAKAAIVGIGLPDWVFPGSVIVMALGLPVILFTAYVHRTARKLVTQTPTFTPGGTPSLAQGTMATLAIKASPHVSWRRATIGGLFAVGAFVVLIVAYMVSRASGVGPFASLLAAGTLQQNEKVLVADFDNRATDSTIAPVVTDAFRTALGQSRSISIFQPNDVRDVLRRMQRPLNTRVDFEVARQVATREGIKAVVVGEVISLGGNYAISVNLVSPTGEKLVSLRETAEGDKQLLPTIDKLAKDLRSRIGESLRNVQNTPALERVTTPSLEALKKYVQGNRIMSFEQDFERGAPLLEEAITLDTGFAMAYRRLAVEYSNRGQDDRAMELLQKAFDHRDRLSDAERYLVMGSYYGQGPRQDLAKSTSAYETLIDLQPDFITPLNNVSINYRWQRDWGKAEEHLRRALAIGNPPVVAYNQMVWTLWNEGKKDEAWRVLAKFDSVFPNIPQRTGRRAELLIAAGKYDSAMAVRANLPREWLSNPNVRGGNAYFAGFTARIRGRLRDAARADSEGIAAGQQTGAKDRPLSLAAHQAITRTLFLNQPAQAAADLDAAMARTPIEQLHPAIRPYIDVAMAYGFAGRADRTRDLLASFERSRRQITRTDDGLIRAVVAGFVAVAEKKYPEALRQFQAADVGDCPSCSLSLLAMGYDLAGKEDSALAVYERYISVNDAFRGRSDQFFLAGAHKRLGELYEAKGDRQNALSHYLAFVDLWKTADPELQPRVAEVRARINRLKDSEGGRAGR